MLLWILPKNFWKRCGLVALLIGMVLLGACGGVPTQQPQPQHKAVASPLPPLSGLPLEALKGQIIGLMPPNQTLQLTIALKMDRQGLAQVAQDIYDSSSAQYGHYLTPQQIAVQFGASDQTIGQVTS